MYRSLPDLDNLANVDGLITSIDPASGTLVVLGQSVFTDNDAIFDLQSSPNSLAGLAVDDHVEVSGRDADTSHPLRRSRLRLNDTLHHTLQAAVFAPLMWRARKSERNDFFKIALMAVAAGTFLYSANKLMKRADDLYRPITDGGRPQPPRLSGSATFNRSPRIRRYSLWNKWREYVRHT